MYTLGKCPVSQAYTSAQHKPAIDSTSLKALLLWPQFHEYTPASPLLRL